jgi:hypothetical protein
LYVNVRFRPQQGLREACHRATPKLAIAQLRKLSSNLAKSELTLYADKPGCNMWLGRCENPLLHF